MTTKVHLTPAMLRDELDRMERKHRMSSIEFYERVHAGTMPEHRDYPHWLFLCVAALRQGVLDVTPTHA